MNMCGCKVTKVLSKCRGTGNQYEMEITVTVTRIAKKLPSLKKFT